MTRKLFGRVFFAALLIGAAAAPAAAQRDNDALQGSFFEITGQVRLPNGRATANDIQVRLEFYGGLVDQTSTDSVGRFRFTRLKRAPYTVVVRVPGYREERQTVDISVVGRAHIILQLTAAEAARPPSGVGDAEVVDAKAPPEARREYEKALAAVEEGKPDRAIPHLEKAVRLYPDFFAAQLLLGNVHMGVSSWEKAEAAFKRASEIRPRTVPVLVSLGEVYRRLKRFEQAQRVLQEGVTLDDKSWQGHFTLGRLYWETGDMSKAGFHTGRALQLHPEYAEAHLLGGNIFMRAGLPENALIEYEEYLRLAPRGEFSAQTEENVRKLKKMLAEKKKP
jgi:tetratricopeptide (TPR) repeat protein